MGRVSFLFIILIFSLCSCAASTRALNAYQKGDYNRFCEISADSLGSDPASYHNIAVCYEKGLGGYQKNSVKALENYVMGARWNVQSSRERLASLGVAVPQPDLKNAQRARTAKVIGGIFQLALAGTAAYYNAKAQANAYNSYYRNSYQGCCSYHGGMKKNYYGKYVCHWIGRVMCNDGQPSPTCSC